MVIFDVNLSLGRWPFRPSDKETRDSLADYLAKQGITGGLVRSAEAALSRVPDLENERLIQRCQGWAGFIPLPIVNPAWKFWRDLKGLPAAALYPGFQHFSLADQATIDMGRGLAERGILPVIVMREEDERAQHPLCKIPPVPSADLDAFAKALGDTPVLVLNAYNAEILRTTAPNLNFDFAFAESCYPLVPLIQKHGAARILYGSHSPFFCASAATSKLADLDGEEATAAVTSRNARRLLRLR